MLKAHDVYRWLMSAGKTSACEAFDAHVLASALALAVEDNQRGVPLTASLGLTPDLLRDTFKTTFPHAAPIVESAAEDPELVVGTDEAALRDLLFRGSTEQSRLEARLSAVIARRALSPNHLWQDLGLRSRRDLSWLMDRHFEQLASKNDRDMKWKKFFYRAICRDTGYALCVAPSCDECADFDDCFGDESGESLLDRSALLNSREATRPRYVGEPQ